MTYNLISTVTVGAGGAANIAFSSIPATYTDLLIVASIREATTANWVVYLTINGDTGASNYTNRRLQGNGSTAISANLTGANIDFIDNSSGAVANTFGNLSIYIPNYSVTGVKALSGDSVGEDNATLAYQRITAGSWVGTAAISSLTLQTTGGNLAQYSTASLYGIA